MQLELESLDKKMLENSISQFRAIPEYVKICEAFAVGCNSIQSSVNYLLDMIDLDRAEGVWLDYIGWLVGEYRGQYVDTSQYFCVNETHTVEGEPAGDINRSRRFYFPSLTSSLGNTSNLSDSLFRNQIKAKIAYNISNGTREDYIRIIKPLVNADKVIINNYAPMLLDIALYGVNILKTNIRERIESILQDGIGIHGDIEIYETLSYETIESEINTIVEMTNISEQDPNYEYEDINDDLDYILEIE